MTHIMLPLYVVRPTPIKELTIPHLELCAAVLATKADKQLRKDIELSVSQSVFWTDSTAVIQYIRNTKRRFLTFVASRVGMIHDMSEPEQWPYVSSESNPVDDASRGVEGDRFTSESRWLRGPSFLSLDERDWPTYPQQISYLCDSDPEVRKECIVLTLQSNGEEDSIKTLIT